jgi:hypothetical protein
MPHRAWDRSLADAVLAGVDLPPLVVFRHRDGDGWGLLDGVSRTNAFVELGIPTARAYELTEQDVRSSTRARRASALAMESAAY